MERCDVAASVVVVACRKIAGYIGFVGVRGARIRGRPGLSRALTTTWPSRRACAYYSAPPAGGKRQPRRRRLHRRAGLSLAGYVAAVHRRVHRRPRSMLSKGLPTNRTRRRVHSRAGSVRWPPREPQSNQIIPILNINRKHTEYRIKDDGVHVCLFVTWRDVCCRFVVVADEFFCVFVDSDGCVWLFK